MKNENGTLEELQGYKRKYDESRTKYEVAKDRVRELEGKLKALGIEPTKVKEELSKLTAERDVRKKKFYELMGEIHKNVAGI